MAYGDFKNLPRRTTSEKVLRDKAFNIAKNPNTIDIKVKLLQWFVDYLIKSLQVELLKAKLCQIND